MDLQSKLEKVLMTWNRKAQAGTMNAWKSEVDAKFELRGKLEIGVARWNNKTTMGTLNAWKAG